MEANRTGMRWTWDEFARLPSDGATEPEVAEVGGHLRWIPLADGPTLEVAVAELVPRDISNRA